jgi:hypothetical protein
MTAERDEKARLWDELKPLIHEIEEGSHDRSLFYSKIGHLFLRRDSEEVTRIARNACVQPNKVVVFINNSQRLREKETQLSEAVRHRLTVIQTVRNHHDVTACTIDRVIRSNALWFTGFRKCLSPKSDCFGKPHT